MNSAERKCVDRVAAVLDGKEAKAYGCTCYVCTRLLPSTLCFARGCQVAVEELQSKLASEQKKLIIVP